MLTIVKGYCLVRGFYAFVCLINLQILCEGQYSKWLIYLPPQLNSRQLSTAPSTCNYTVGIIILHVAYAIAPRCFMILYIKSSILAKVIFCQIMSRDVAYFDLRNKRIKNHKIWLPLFLPTNLRITEVLALSTKPVLQDLIFGYMSCLTQNHWFY